MRLPLGCDESYIKNMVDTIFENIEKHKNQGTALHVLPEFIFEKNEGRKSHYCTSWRRIAGFC
jgi:hypothetical protein